MHPKKVLCIMATILVLTLAAAIAESGHQHASLSVFLHNIQGSIAANDLVGGVGNNTVGPITDGRSKWQFSQDDSLDLDCYNDDGCIIETSDTHSNQMSLTPSGMVFLGQNSASYLKSDGSLQLIPQKFAKLPPCFPGVTYNVSDSTTNVIGAPITGGGSYTVQAFCGGLDWTVAAGGKATSGVTAAGTSCTVTAITDGVITAASCTP